MRVEEEPLGDLSELAQIPIAFTVDRVLEVSVTDEGLGGIALNEVTVDEPWTKDYDAEADGGPTRWPGRFDVTNWGLIAARQGDELVGGAVIAFDTPELHMLRGRRDVAVLWDLRVLPEVRSGGTGTLLWRAAEQWATDRGCRSLRVETQNINVAACRFYRKMGCTLASVDRLAYADLPNETQLIWAKALGDPAADQGGA